MRRAQTTKRFAEEVPRILRERGLSIRALARAADVTDAHLSRVLRGVNYKTASPDLARRVALALDLPEDYFPEYREGIVIERIRHDPRLRDRLYQEFSASPSTRQK